MLLLHAVNFLELLHPTANLIKTPDWIAERLPRAGRVKTPKPTAHVEQIFEKLRIMRTDDAAESTARA